MLLGVRKQMTEMLEEGKIRQKDKEACGER